MKKIIITISLVIPILLSAAPVFAALSTAPVGSTNFNDLQITVSGLDNRRIILVDPTGIIVGDTRATHGYPYPFADGTYTMSQLGFTSAGTGNYTVLTTYQDENGIGSCTPGSTLSSCIGMINAGAGYYTESTFDLLVPPPYAAINSGDLSVPTSSTNDLLASVSNVIGNAGFLGIFVVAMALPLFFWFAKEAIAINRHNKKRK
jgi:hypothetical protein